MDESGRPMVRESGETENRGDHNNEDSNQGIKQFYLLFIFYGSLLFLYFLSFLYDSSQSAKDFYPLSYTYTGMQLVIQS